MSYANDACANRFSDEQIAAMRANILDDRQNLLTDQSDRMKVEQPITIIGPDEFEQVQNGVPVSLSWTSSEGADYYFLEIDYFLEFNTEDYQSFFLTDTTFLYDAIDNQGHFWRVRPLNDYDGCTPGTPFRVFITTEVTSTNTITAVDSWTIAPNPMSSGQQLQLSLNNSQPLNGTISLWNSVGQRVQTLAQINLPAGQQQLSFDIINHPAGLYLLVIDTPEGRLSKKLIVRN
jgi:hypothetical protein